MAIKYVNNVIIYRFDDKTKSQVEDQRFYREKPIKPGTKIYATGTVATDIETKQPSRFARVEITVEESSLHIRFFKYRLQHLNDLLFGSTGYYVVSERTKEEDLQLNGSEYPYQKIDESSLPNILSRKERRLADEVQKNDLFNILDRRYFEYEPELPLQGKK